MATARDIITRALRRAHVIANGETPAGELLTGALASLNEMLEAWQDEGIPTGIKGLLIDTTLAIDDGARRAIIDNLAVELADNEGLPVSGPLATRAERGRSSLQARYLGTRKVRFDPALHPDYRYDIDLT
jgi:hypothetical protein